MTSSEFLAARKTLDLTQEEMAGELGLTPHVIAGMENGEARVPKAIEKELTWRVAVAHRDALLAASGLPECPIALELQRSVGEQSGEAMVKAGEAFIAHVESCPICKAREEFAKKHVPPMPDMPLPAWFRGMAYLESLLLRLPRPLRPPEGDEGEGRRFGVWMAVIFSLIAIAVSVLGAISGLVARGLSSSWWREPLAIIATVPLAYLVGFFLAGAVYDLTRPIGRRFIGYVLRGGLMVPAVYGSVGVVVPLLSKDNSWSSWPSMVVAFGVMGAFGGGVLWVFRRITGKLPSVTA